MANRKSGKKYSKGKSVKNKSGKNKSGKKKVKISLKKGGSGGAPLPTPILTTQVNNTSNQGELKKVQEDLKKVHEELKQELKLVKERLNKLETTKTYNATVPENGSHSKNISSTEPYPPATAAPPDGKCSIM